MEENEQWVKGGDCKKCRRQNYCSKPCKEYKSARQVFLRGAFKEALVRKSPAAFGAVVAMNQITNGKGEYL